MSYIRPVIDHQKQPYDTPFSSGDFQQVITAGNDFNGTIPDDSVAGGPTEGGRWMFNEDVVIERLEFRSLGIEAAARSSAITAPGEWYNGLPSGFYVSRLGGNPKQISHHIVLNVASTSQFVALSDQFILKRGELLRLVTGGATLAMEANVMVELRRPYTVR